MGDSGDYIFTRQADGSLAFKGDFEGLYKAEPDPWGQGGTHPRMKEYYDYSRLVLCLHLYSLPLPKWGSLLEVGCGEGHVANLIRNASYPTQRVEGVDISETAIARARNRYPRQKFLVGDFASTTLELGSRYDVIVLNQMLWYVLDRLPTVFANAGRLLRSHGHLIIQTAFLDKQEYGREIVDGFNGLLRYVLDHHTADFQVVTASYDHSSRYAPYHDGLLVLQATS